MPQLVREYLLDHHITADDKRRIEEEWCKALRDRLDIWHDDASKTMKRAFLCRQLCDIFHITYSESDENDYWHQLFHDNLTGLTIDAGMYLRTSPYSVQISFDGGMEFQKVVDRIHELQSIHTPENITENTVFYYEFRNPVDIELLVQWLISIKGILGTNNELWDWASHFIGNWRNTTKSLYDDYRFAALKLMHNQWNLVQDTQPEHCLVSSSGLFSLNGRYNWKGDFGLQFRDGECRVIDFWCNTKNLNQNAIRDELLRRKLSLNYVCDYWNANRYPYHFVFSIIEDGQKLLELLLAIREALVSSNA